MRLADVGTHGVMSLAVVAIHGIMCLHIMAAIIGIMRLGVVETHGILGEAIGPTTTLGEGAGPTTTLGERTRPTTTLGPTTIGGVGGAIGIGSRGKEFLRRLSWSCRLESVCRSGPSSRAGCTKR